MKKSFGTIILLTIIFLMTIRIGDIILASHQDDLGRENYHPFLIINITKNNIYGIQCSSIKDKDMESHFSRNEYKYIKLENTKMNNPTHVRTDLFESIEISKVDKVLMLSHPTDFEYICAELLNLNWKNNEWFSAEEVKGHILKGFNNYGMVWSI